ncbi:MAG: glycosyltransferase [Gammaproteobacteria bacterium]|nr:glycosyltransferase [Gammaproteobacteria bacterium]
MISIITAVYNQLAVNQIFVENLRRYSRLPHELIIIDNHSNDGSREYFHSVGARVIENDANYSYPVCQNKGIAIAKYPTYAFLNNDIIVAPGWDEKLLAVMRHHDLDIATPSDVERSENPKSTRRLKRRWQRIKNFLGLFGYRKSNLERMHRWMYRGGWEAFCARREQIFGTQIIEAFSGNSIMMTRNGLDKVGLWDERIQAADFDLYIRARKRFEEKGDVKPVHVALGVFHHHYVRMTMKTRYPPFADRANIVTLAQKWGEETVRHYTGRF